ncbi:hypothetical protein DAEQUDRAFT_760583 [Daedalea quercina L-15889]|uniref:Uncharacterized protein n=1 Tax=Daedalea quercina L-15889 TaxID=1314783 RepID=A0A165KJM0_9APHY|nr:hypothetical protein DAEQUDRAFT_760583 [Daedalea quercina L-15889]
MNIEPRPPNHVIDVPLNKTPSLPLRCPGETRKSSDSSEMQYGFPRTIWQIQIGGIRYYIARKLTCSLSARLCSSSVTRAGIGRRAWTWSSRYRVLQEYDVSCKILDQVQDSVGSVQSHKDMPVTHKAMVSSKSIFNTWNCVEEKAAGVRITIND